MDLAPATTGALTRFETLHETESFPTPKGPLPTGRPGDSNDIPSSARPFVNMKRTEFEFIDGDKSLTEQKHEGVVCGKRGENGKPDIEITDIDWPV